MINSNTRVFVQNIDLVNDVPKSPVDTNILFVEGDVDSSVIVCNVKKRGEQFSLDDYDVAIIFNNKKRAPNYVVNGNIIEIWVPREGTDKAGTHSFCIKITDKDDTRTLVSAVYLYDVASSLKKGSVSNA